MPSQRAGKKLRAQREYGQAIRAVLQVLALAAVTLSLLVETPSDVRRRP